MIPWREAMRQALYGPGGFFVSGEGPAAHFRTSATASGLFATAVARLVERVDRALGHPATFTVVDVGAGRGELLSGLAAALPTGLQRRTSLVAVERAGRPANLPEFIDWRDTTPDGTTGLLVATEWLDNVPLDVVEVDETGTRRILLVDPATGDERPGPPVSAADEAWLDRWWPDPGVRAEVGRTRDEAWASTVATLRRGLAVAVDYGHLLPDRPVAGTLTGYRDGRQVPPVPDGSRDVTAHVAMDAVAASGAAVAGVPATLLSQRDALRRLGVTGKRPPLSAASTDPAGYLRALATASQAAELTDPGGLGAHYWLLQPVGLDTTPLP